MERYKERFYYNDFSNKDLENGLRKNIIRDALNFFLDVCDKTYHMFTLRTGVIGNCPKQKPESYLAL
jgi:hypothetical protein